MMKKIELGEVVSTIANIGVIASLIFVGLQLRQESAATRSATVLQIKQSWVEINMELATSKELGDALARLEEAGWESLSIQDQLHITSFFRALFTNWSNAYYQFLIGTLEKELWLPHLREAESNARNPVVRQLWSDWAYLYDEPFQQLMETLIAQAKIEGN